LGAVLRIVGFTQRYAYTVRLFLDLS
jgi:hypothetical protein